MSKALGARGGGGPGLPSHLYRPPARKLWIPIDIKLRWFQFLSVEDLANCGAVCKAWVVLSSRTADAEWRQTTGTDPPKRVARLTKLRLLRRIRQPLLPENMGWLLTMAAGRKDMLPYMHKLLLHRDDLRMRLGIPGAFFRSRRARSPFLDLPPPVRSIFEPHTEPELTHHVDWGHATPLTRAVATGNVEAVHLLLMFGDTPNHRDASGRRPITEAVVQGDVRALEALLGRVPLRAPVHPPHLASRMGLFRRRLRGAGTLPAWRRGEWGMKAVADDSAGSGSDGLSAWEKKAAAALAKEGARPAWETGEEGGEEGAEGQAAVARTALERRRQERQEAVLEARGDGRYAAWCSGLDLGCFWSSVDTSVGAGLERDPEAMQKVLPLRLPNGAGGGRAGGGAAGRAAPPAGEAAAADGEEDGGDAIEAPRDAAAEARAAAEAADLEAQQEGSSINPDYAKHMRTVADLLPSCELEFATLVGVRAARYAKERAAEQRYYAAMRAAGIDMHQLKQQKEGSQAGHQVPAASGAGAADPLGERSSRFGRSRGRSHVHPRLPPVPDEGSIAALASAQRARLNTPQSEGKTAVLIAAEKGRNAHLMLLLSHHCPADLAAAAVPPVYPRPEVDDDGNQRPPPPPPPVTLEPPGGESRGDPRDLRLRSFAGEALRSIPPEYESLITPGRRHRADPDACPPGANTPLCVVCERGDGIAASLLLHWGADTNKQGKKEASPLLLAALKGHDHILSLLLRVSLPERTARSVGRAIEVIRARYRVKRGRKGAGAAAGEDDEATPLGSAAGSLGAPFQAVRVDPLPGRTRHEAASQAASLALRFIEKVQAQATSKPAASGAAGGGGASRSAQADASVRAARDAAAASSAAGSQSTAESILQRLLQDRLKATNIPAAVRRAAMAAASEQAAKERREDSLAIDWQTGDSEGVLMAQNRVKRKQWRLWESQEVAWEKGLAVLPPLNPFHESTHVESRRAAQKYAESAGDDLDALGSLDGPKLEPARGAGEEEGTRRKARGAAESEVVCTCEPAADQLRRLGCSLVVEEDEDGNTVLRVEPIGGALQQPPGWLWRRFGLERRLRLLLRRSRALNSPAGLVVGREPVHVDQEDTSGYSPLFLCASAGNADAVAVLLAAGADPLHATKRGKSVLYVAVEKGYSNVVEALLPYMSPMHVRYKTKYGTDVMHAAKKHGKREVMRLLEDFLIREDGREARRLEKMGAEKRWGPGAADDRAQWAKKQAKAMERLRTGSQRQLIPGSSSGSTGAAAGGGGGATSSSSTSRRAQSRSRDPRPRPAASSRGSAAAVAPAPASARSKSVDPMAKVRALRAAAEKAKKAAEARKAAKRATATTGAVVDLGMAMGLGMEAAASRDSAGRGPAPPTKKPSKRSRSVAPQRKASRRLAPSEEAQSGGRKPPSGRSGAPDRNPHHPVLGERPAVQETGGSTVAPSITAPRTESKAQSDGAEPVRLQSSPVTVSQQARQRDSSESHARAERAMAAARKAPAQGSARDVSGLVRGGTLKRASSAGIREMARMEVAAAEGAGEGKEEEAESSAPAGGAQSMSKAYQRRAARAAHFDRLFASKPSVGNESGGAGAPPAAPADVVLAGASAALAGLPSLANRPQSPLGPPAAGRPGPQSEQGGSAVISPLQSANPGGGARDPVPRGRSVPSSREASPVVRPDSSSAAVIRRRYVVSARSAASAGASSPVGGAFRAATGGASPSALALRAAESAAYSSRAGIARARKGGGGSRRDIVGAGTAPLVPRRAFADLEADVQAASAAPTAGNNVGGATRVRRERPKANEVSPVRRGDDLGLGVGGVGLQVAGSGTGGDAGGGGWVGVGDRVAEERRQELQKERRAEERLRARLYAGGAKAMMPGGGGGAPVRVPAAGSRESSPLQPKPKKRDTLKMAAMAYGMGGKPGKKKKKAPHKRSLLML